MGHIHDLYDFTTSAFIVNDGRVLLLHHKKIGVWLQPGGHIELNEDPLEALYREVEEETGLAPSSLTIVETAKEKRQNEHGNKLLPLPFDFNVHQFDETHKHIDISYIMRSSTDEVRLEANKAHDIRWCSPGKMQELLKQKLIYEDTVELAELALKFA